MKNQRISSAEDLMDYVRKNPKILEHLPGKHDQREHTRLSYGGKKGKGDSGSPKLSALEKRQVEHIANMHIEAGSGSGSARGLALAQVLKMRK